MKLLATSRVQFVDRVNTSLILNYVWQMLSDSTRINSEQSIQDILEYADASYRNRNLVNYYDLAKNSINFNSFLKSFKIYFFQLFFIYFPLQKVNEYYN